MMTRMMTTLGAALLVAGVWLLAAVDGNRLAAQGMELDICPTSYASFPENAPDLTCGCSAEAVKAGTVWGTNPYYYGSSLCRAALHAGAVGPQGGRIVVKPERAPFYPQVLRNGVSSSSSSADMGFRVVVAGQPGTQAAAPGGGTPAAPAPTGPSSTGPSPTGMQLDICPTSYSSFPEDAPDLTCGCSAEAAKAGTVWGANPYYYGSSLCRAALHAGAIGPQGGKIVVKPDKAPFFPQVLRNGVASSSSSADKGFRVVVAGQPATQAAAPGGGMELDVCPTSYGSFPENAPDLTCGCSAEAAKAGTVWGTNPYYYGSSLCRAALHAGAIGAQGGKIVVKPERAPFYPQVLRNGVASSSSSADMGFRVVVAGQPATQAAAPGGGMELDICPTSYSNFPEDAPDLTCGCSAEAVKAGTVWGANPYYYGSSLCRAALHAGAVGAQGGKILVKPDKAPFYPQVLRNGVSSSSSSADKGFRVVVAAAAQPSPAPAPPPAAPAAPPARPAVDMTGKPIQAPVAATLRETGRVQLYVNFATDQSKPLPSSEPVLQELLAALQGDPTLKVELVGHTDSQGGAPYNLDLSQRRAAAVYLWLIQHGVDSGRLRSDGRGLMEPIADNTTEWGRALNRRVEVKAVR
jgi:outer membrane protein OmpA-like peptidoglycan-associated protein